MKNYDGSNKVRLIISFVTLAMILLAVFTYMKWQNEQAPPNRQEQEIR